MSTEDDKLKVDSIGLFNIGEEEGSKTYKVKLNMSDCPKFSLFEGEVIVAEGFNDSNSRFNVRTIHKPQINPPSPTEWSLLQHSAQQQQNKALHIIAAAGPFTSPSDLQY
jgi:DNA polymerase alpha subunit B